jgi:hypothetical protein
MVQKKRHNQKQPEIIKKKFPDLEQVYGSTFCRFSVVENKLAGLYRNQQKIYNLLKEIANVD